MKWLLDQNHNQLSLLNSFNILQVLFSYYSRRRFTSILTDIHTHLLPPLSESCTSQMHVSPDLCHSVKLRYILEHYTFCTQQYWNKSVTQSTSNKSTTAVQGLLFLLPLSPFTVITATGFCIHLFGHVLWNDFNSFRFNIWSHSCCSVRFSLWIGFNL